MRRITDQAARHPLLTIEPLDTASLDAREAAQAHALYDATIRRWWTLEWLVERGAGRPASALEPVVRSALLVGAAQILLMDRMPVYAAIDRAVAWVKPIRGPGAGGLVNAVLRRVSEMVTVDRRASWQGGADELPLADGSAAVLAEAALPADPASRLSLACSLPAWACRRWVTAWGEEVARSFGVHALSPGETTLNTRFAASAVERTRPHDAPGCAVWSGDRDSLVELLQTRDDVWVQDASSAGAVEAIVDRSPRVIVDICAGMGTKTRQLGWSFPEAELIASDVDAGRMAQLRTAGRRVPNPDRVTVCEASEVLELAGGRADLVLVDAPCTNSGVLARRVEARHRLTPDSLTRLSETQKQIVADSVRLLAPGGIILYATCSVEDEENGGIGRWAAQWHGVKAERARSAFPSRGQNPEGASRYRDGAYSVVLRG